MFLSEMPKKNVEVQPYNMADSLKKYILSR